jgi:hypothetical protein
MDCQTVLANATGATRPLPSIDILLWHLCWQVTLASAVGKPPNSSAACFCSSLRGFGNTARGRLIVTGPA